MLPPLKPPWKGGTRLLSHIRLVEMGELESPISLLAKQVQLPLCHIPILKLIDLSSSKNGRRGGSCNHDPLLIRQPLLLLSYPPRRWSELRDLNSRSSPPKGDAIPDFAKFRKSGAPAQIRTGKT